MEEMSVLMQGPRRGSRFDTGVYSKSSRSPDRMTSKAATRAWVTDCMGECSGHRSLEDEEYGLGQWLTAVEQTQQQMMQEFEEVILTIPDMMIQALRAEQEVQQPAPAILPLQGSSKYGVCTLNFSYPILLGAKVSCTVVLCLLFSSSTVYWNPEGYHINIFVKLHPRVVRQNAIAV
ncbi:UNVERIFIED_CONTAM: hypothetical protein K2H54_058273 [Gekko kuhli]